jgi:hypothetical protein
MKQKTNPEEKAPKKGTKALKDRIHKHLADKNDVITDEDIKNIKVGDDTADENTEQSENFVKALEEKKLTSPWTILSEEDK